ncbi:CHRD domain-containing protein [Oculatella sp. FACHB-28]|uniref:CHRD domain-containing protein n=1 Tax=Cyanophyceae TaxID=3028117 RepID=UPI0016840827|nr:MULTISPECIES: CHRD domain-containing protein [Cyanophyceae]MBD1866917.1 CHRD domain-containing protein [Cyanobacteria bacterium FACHB-471]MBD2058946.1 CHRD domain-containing protein [Oculatella sp. FACHB-28]MBD2070974.1 CHRD domain-containing protein [Leptolyngbya sp. FACHB-671]
MNRKRQILFNFLLGVVACVLLINLSSTPSFSNSAISTPQAFQASNLDLINQQLVANLRETDDILMAQNTTAGPIMRYVAVLNKNNVIAPTAPSSSAFGAAGAVLVGDRLIVKGDFSNLSSALRDYATDPLDPPNPNITSGVHIHQGESTTNGAFQYALDVTPDASQLKGRFSGEYTLTQEQLQALSSGNLYVDLHTQMNRAGELRGVFQAY